MKKIFLSILGLVFLSGCGTTAIHEVRTRSELKYKKILVMPFTKGAEVNAALAQNTFISELSLFSDLSILGKGKMDETTIKNLGVNHPDSFGPLDFSSSPEADERRKKVLDSFPADGVVFGYTYIDQGLLSLHIQMIDSSTGELILGFSRDASIPEGLPDDTIQDLARKSAQKTIEFLKDNIIITNIHRR